MRLPEEHRVKAAATVVAVAMTPYECERLGL